METIREHSRDDALDLYAPDDTPWCSFKGGLKCVNGDACLNKNHRS